MSVLLTICLAFSAIISACEEPVPTATVRFFLDAPLCSGSQIPLQFRIDAIVVGEATLMNGDTTRAFTTTVGTHVLGARLNGSSFDQDTTVVLVESEVAVKRMDFYCS